MQTTGGVAKSLAKDRMNSRLSFFKFISSSEKMEFPPGAAARMQGILGDGAFLIDEDQHLWEVGVERDGDGFSFEKGWPQFYEENCLEYGDNVVFTYHGDNLFYFKLFGRNGCDKKTTGAPELSVKEEVEELSADDDDDDDDYVEEEVESEEEQRVSCRHKSSRNVSSIHTSAGKKGVKAPIHRIKIEGNEDDEESTNMDDSDDIEIMMEEGDYEEEEPTSIGQAEKKPRSSSSGIKRAYKKQKVPDCYGHDIFESGLAIRPNNPYFVSRSRKPRRNELYIPRDVIVDFRLKIPTRLFLIDGRGKKWETKTKKWRDGRMWCTRGWRSLCNVNNIGVDDTCICEFVQRGQDGMCMLVRVVDGAPRAASGGSRNFFE